MFDQTSKRGLSQAEQEAELLGRVEELMMTKSAAEVDTQVPPVVTDDSRFEARESVEQPPEGPDNDADAAEGVTGEPTRASSTKWGTRPSVRNQALERPETVRFINPTTKVLRFSDADHLTEYNRIQRAASDAEAPTLAITEVEKQPHNGTWHVLITFCEIQYMQL
jgi:hypothetical protein